MQYLVALALAGAIAWLISTIGAGSIERAVSAIAQLVGGWRPDPWPRGVQEEDRDRPWQWRVPLQSDTARRSIDEPVTRPPASRVIPRTRVR